jgi:hypothetical protein
VNEQFDHQTAHDSGSPDGEFREAEAEVEVETQSTGNEDVDGVLRSLDDLESRPVEEHVAVFESAHERLRAVLSGAGQDGSGPRRP